MTKSETKLMQQAMKAGHMGATIGEPAMIGYAARAISSLIRATKTDANRNEMITIAAGIQAIVQHPDFIV